MKKLILFAVALALSACAQLGMQSPDTFNKKVATAQVLVQTVAQGASAALAAGKLSKADAENVVVTGRASLQAIMVAQSIYLTACPLLPQIETSDPKCTSPAADAKLQATLAVLTALQAYVATQQGAK